jgi:hypothetical protein
MNHQCSLFRNVRRNRRVPAARAKIGHENRVVLDLTIRNSMFITAKNAKFGGLMATLTINASYGNSLKSLNNDGNSADQAVYNGYTSAITSAINYFDNNFQTLGTTNVSFTVSFGCGSIPNANGTNGAAVTSGATTDTVPQVLQYTTTDGSPSFYSIMRTAYNTANNANATALQTGAITNGIIPATSPYGTNGAIVMTPAQEALLSST